MHRVELRGGLNTVWLIDNRVHRPAGPWSSSVHALLRHVSAAGFASAPVPFGFDAEGREVLSYLPGEVGHHFPMSDEAVVSAARLLRRYHDATVGFAGGEWQCPAIEPAEVLCHGDFAQYNLVFDGDTAVGMIDFDWARPAPRWYDVAYGVYRFALMDLDRPLDRQLRGAALFCDSYGASAATRSGVADNLAAHLIWMAELVEQDPRFVTQRAEEHNQMYRAHAAAVPDLHRTLCHG
ncbi:phosphotransferase family enzyme [Kutzneria buriramensis]|uniref:Phosphotransferase family enzyme n=1 Tax=Kutzneria buriramensis TaxID=1045776 RepID=A0A3E0IA29_9PSEU|nr:phosphotransferase family enzyme [Kutzneria buriramensis]